METWLESIWNSITSFFDWIVWFLGGGIFEFFVFVFDYLIGICQIIFYVFLTSLLVIVNGLLSSIFDGLHYSSDVVSAWNLLPSEVIQALSFFNVPQSVLMITSAYATRFVINLTLRIF